MSDYQRHIEDATFEGCTVKLDGCAFKGCTFKDTVFEYEGGSISFVNCVFVTWPVWSLGGPLGGGLRAIAIFHKKDPAVIFDAIGAAMIGGSGHGFTVQ